MRKLIAIFMLAVFAFNVAGYQLLYDYFSQQSDAVLEAVLDEQHYKDEELITITQPTNLPYYSNSREYQRIDGEVEVDGILYKYVKCRVFNGSLEMLCIPNKAKMKIEQSKNDYAKVVHGFQQTDTKKNGSPTKSFQKIISDYDQQPLFMIHCGSKALTNNYVQIRSVFTTHRFFTTVEQPPDVA